MAWLSGLAHRITRLLARGRVEHDLNEEIRFHLELDIERNVAAGMTEGEARRQAQLRFGGVENIKEQVRDETGVRWIEDFVQDVRYGLRGLRRAPAFTAAALISLSIGIGANTAVFSVLNGVLLRPLPYPDQDQLQYLRVEWRDFDGPLSDADFLTLQAQGERLGAIVGYWSTSFTLTTSDGPRAISGAWVTDRLTDVFAVRPIAGRAFLPEDELVVLVSYEFWQTRFGGTSDALGRTLELDGQAYRVIGIMPPGFDLPRQEGGNVWALRPITEPSRRGPFYIRAAARLATGVTQTNVSTQLNSAEAQVRQAYAASSGEWRYKTTPLKNVIVGDIGHTLAVLSVVVMCVLLIAVANVVNLLLARGTSREREVAMRAALGARRGRIVRQLLTESAILGLFGGLVGLVFAAGVVELVVAGGTALVPRLDEVSIDGRVLGYALLLGVLSGALSGIVPAFTLKYPRLSQVLKEGGRSGTGGRARRIARNALVVGEFGLALAILISSVLLVKSLVRLQNANLGIDGEGVMVFNLALPNDPYIQQGEFNGFLSALERRIAALPGVSHVGFSTSLPPDRLAMTNNYVVEGDEPGPDGYQPTAEWIPSSEGYFDALRVPLARGRSFTPSDDGGAPGVVAVNGAFVRQHFPNQDPVGKRIQSGNFNPGGGWLTIVGVVGDVSYDGAAGGVSPTVYAPLRQDPGWYGNFFTVVRASVDFESLLPALRAALAELEPRVPLRNVSTMEQIIRRSTAAERFRSSLFTVLALLALVLAATGVYGVVSFSVTSKQRETAIQRALGASNARVFATVLKQGLLLAALGTALGLGGAGVFSRFIRALLFDVSATDLTVYGGAGLTMLAVAIMACLLPSLRASRSDPMAALREE